MDFFYCAFQVAWLIACFPRFTCARIGGKLIAGFNDSFPLLSITALFFRQTISLAFSCCFPTSWLWVELLLQLSDHKLLDSKFYFREGLVQHSSLHLVWSTEEQLQSGPNKAGSWKKEDQGWAEAGCHIQWSDAEVPGIWFGFLDRRGKSAWNGSCRA